MKKRCIKIFTRCIGIALSLLFIVPWGTFATDVNKISEENSMVSKINLMDKNTLLTKANESFIKGENLIEYSTVISEKINGFKESNILEMINSNIYCTNFKVSLLQAYELDYSKKSSEMNEKLIDLLKSDIDNEIKKEIIVFADFSNNTYLLKESSNQNDSELSSQALIKLSRINFDSALDIANEVINNQDKYCENLFIASINIKANQISENNCISIKETNDFMDICIDLINEKSENDVVGLAARFALVEINNRKAISFLVKNNKISQTSKIYSVGQNCGILMDMIKSGNKDEVEVAVQSMTIYPLNVFYDELIKLKESNQFLNKELLNQAIELIEKEGEDVIDKETGKVLDATTLKSANFIIFNNPNPDSVTTASVSAASRYQGYAVYRNGVPFGVDLTWHAGIMGEPLLSSSSIPIVHIPGLLYSVIWDSWSNFLGSNDYQGLYAPKTAITTYQRANVVNTAQQLTVNTNIEYILKQQISYSTSSGVVSPSRITAIRCDGVVEYCYEYWGIRIYGADSNWDISINNSANLDAHKGINVTPKKQAEQYMKRNLPPSVEPDY